MTTATLLQRGHKEVVLRFVAIALSLCVAAMGLAGVVAPTSLLGFGRIFESYPGLLAAAAIRLVFGAALIVVADATRAPTALRVVGVLALIGGGFTLILGVERLRAILDWVAGQGPLFLRVWGLVAMAIGALLVYALQPRGDTR